MVADIVEVWTRNPNAIAKPVVMLRGLWATFDWQDAVFIDPYPVKYMDDEEASSR